MANHISQKAVPDANSLDFSPFLFEISDPWLKSVSYQFMGRLLAGVRRQSPLAYKVGHHFQDKKDVYFPSGTNISYPINIPKTVLKDTRHHLAKLDMDIDASQEAYHAINAAITASLLLINEEERQARDLKLEYSELKKHNRPISKSMAQQVLSDAHRKKYSKTIKRYESGPSHAESLHGAHAYDWAFLRHFLNDEAVRLAADSKPESRPPSYTNMLKLSERFGFTSLQREFLSLLICREEVKEMQTFMKGVVGDKLEFDIELMARMLGGTKEQLQDELKMTSSLVRTGMVLIEADKVPTINRDIYKRLNRPGLTFSEIVEDISGQVREAKLTLENYPNIRKDVDLAVRLLDDALKHNRTGVNVLLYGPVGTGKTELMAAVAQSLNRKLRCPGEKSKDGSKALSRGERLASMLLALAVEGDDLLGFDEMEDALPEGMNADDKDKNIGGKVFMNRLLEENRRPVVWVMNHPEMLSEAVLRRFAYSIFVPTPPVSVRAQMYATISKSAGRELPIELCSDLARQFRVSPAYIEHAVKFEKAVNEDEAPDSELIIRNIRAAAHRVAKSQFAFDVENVGTALFNPSFINSNVDLENIENKIRDVKLPGFAACLWGPPGTGKSAWARYIAADVLGMELLVKRYSELSSKYVGEAEKLIRSAFEEAKAGNMALLIDEADSFLLDRGKAEHSWEITEVNEMLTCLERVSTPTFVSTNLMDRLDPAALRRFTFKLNFGYMETQQARDCFETYFDLEAPGSLDQLKNLTPGDFANVYKQTEILGKPDAEGLADLLVEECKLKPDAARSIGFMASMRPPTKSKMLANGKMPHDKPLNG